MPGDALILKATLTFPDTTFSHGILSTCAPCNAEGFPAARHAQRRRGVCRAHAPGVGLC